MSLTPQVFDVYRSPVIDESIQRLETRTYYPYVKSFMNNDIVEITINQGDAWLLMYDAALFIKGKIEKKSGEGSYDLVNNGAAFFFDSISYELNGKELDSVRDPGIVSSIRAYLCYAPDDEKHLLTSSWLFPGKSSVVNTDGTFCVRVPLKHLFGIFNDYEYAICGKQTIRLTRARNDNNCLLLQPTSNTDLTAEVTITNIELKVKHIQPNDMLRLNLLKAIKANKPILIPFRKWEIHELPNLTVNATREIWSVKTSAAVESPRFVIVGFQTDRKENTQSDPTKFDHIDVSDVRLILNGEYFPFERLRQDINKDYLEVYNNYIDFYPSFMNTRVKRPLLSYSDFKERATLFVIDCSRKNEPIKTSTVDIKLDIESTKGFPNKTRAYCIIIHDSVLEYLPLSETIRNIVM